MSTFSVCRLVRILLLALTMAAGPAYGEGASFAWFEASGPETDVEDIRGLAEAQWQSVARKQTLNFGFTKSTYLYHPAHSHSKPE